MAGRWVMNCCWSWSSVNSAKTMMWMCRNYWNFFFNCDLTDIVNWQSLLCGLQPKKGIQLLLLPQSFSTPIIEIAIITVGCRLAREKCFCSCLHIHYAAIWTARYFYAVYETHITSKRNPNLRLMVVFHEPCK